MKAFLKNVVLSLVVTCVSACVWENTEEDIDYLPLNDSNYPYADCPRIVIETENFRQIRDKITEIPAKLQIYGEGSPISPIFHLKVRGRGNSSFQYMAKYGIKLEFDEAADILGMPANKDWALISNYADRTHLRNYLTYKLSGWLGDDYYPRGVFVELYLNREYMGLYLLTETVKVSKNRVDIAKSDTSFLLEKDATKKPGNVNIKTSEGGFYFKICSPKNPSKASQELVQQHLSDFEKYLRNYVYFGKEPITDWMDLEDYFRYYWVQEFSKNYDGAFRRSLFLTWEKGDAIKWGPVWDFDAAYGNWKVEDMPSVSRWYVRDSGWNRWMFRNEQFEEKAEQYWVENHKIFESILDSIDFYAGKLKKATENDFNRWPILEEDELWTFRQSFGTYEETVDTLKAWISDRIKWIDANL